MTASWVSRVPWANHSSLWRTWYSRRTIYKKSWSMLCRSSRRSNRKKRNCKCNCRRLIMMRIMRKCTKILLKWTSSRIMRGSRSALTTPSLTQKQFCNSLTRFFNSPKARLWALSCLTRRKRSLWWLRNQVLINQSFRWASEDYKKTVSHRWFQISISQT